MIKIQETSYFTTFESGLGEWLDSDSRPGRKHNNPFVKKSCQQPPPTSHPYPLTPALYYPAGEGRYLHCFPPLSVALRNVLEVPHIVYKSRKQSPSRSVECLLNRVVSLGQLPVKRITYFLFSSNSREGTDSSV